MNAYDIEQMNARIAARWRDANKYETVPVRPPSWAAAVVDADGELLAIHRRTAAPYPLSIHSSDLYPEDRAVVVIRRILSAGATFEALLAQLYEKENATAKPWRQPAGTAPAAVPNGRGG